MAQDKEAITASKSIAEGASAPANFAAPPSKRIQSGKNETQGNEQKEQRRIRVMSKNARTTQNKTADQTTDSDQATALVVEHQVKKENVEAYEKWNEEILEMVSRSAGYLGREVFPPNSHDKPYTIIVRFESEKNVQTWLDSPQRQAFIEKARDILEDGDKTQIKAGIDVWFTPDDAPAKPPAHKQFLLTLAGIYPLTLIVPEILSPLFEAVPILENPFISKFIVAVIIVGMMTYLFMPYATRWLHGWLFDPPAKRN